jgi:ketosteroid isomerase-like protein
MTGFGGKLFVVAIVLGLSAVLASSSVLAASKKSDAKVAVPALLQQQADAWNRGDLGAFMTGYLKSAEISYTAGGTEVWGYEALKERYEKKYGSDRESMGKLQFSDLKISELGRDHALCIGRWHLERAEKNPLDGVFSLVLTRTSEGWKVIHDHTSLSEKPHS